MQIGGGLGDEYMHAPALQVGGQGGSKGGGSFFANLLDLLGVHRQVAKGPKDAKGLPGEKAPKDASHTNGKAIDPRGGAPEYTPMIGASTTNPAAAPPPALHLLDEADAAFSAIRPRVSKMGSGFSFLPNTLR